MVNFYNADNVPKNQSTSRTNLDLFESPIEKTIVPIENRISQTINILQFAGYIMQMMNISFKLI